MRILHINTEKTWRGGEKQLDILIRHLPNSVDQILACRRESELTKRMKNVLPLLHSPLINGIDFWSAWQVARFCRNAEVDIVHCHTPKAHGIGLISQWMGNPARLVASKRTIFPVKNNYFSRQKYRQSALVICVSEAVKTNLEKQIPGLPLAVINSAFEKDPNIDTIDLGEEIPEARDKTVIGYVAAITKEKDPATFLKVAKKMCKRNKDLIFLWIGEGVGRQALTEAIESNGLERQVILTGFRHNIQQWIAGLDLLFFPSTSEGFPSTLLDAFHLGVPVVASRVGGIQEIISHGENGLMVSIGDTDAFVEAIARILENPTFKSKIIENAKTTLSNFEASKPPMKSIQLTSDYYRRPSSFFQYPRS